jgi:putative transposase
MTRFDPQKHHRRSIRLKGYDYSESGAYFVTVLTWQRECLFGEITGGEMRLNEFGQIVRAEWLKTARIRPHVEIHEDEFVVMPNHLHGIIWIVDDRMVGATWQVAPTQVAPTSVAPTRNKSKTLIPNSLGAIIGQFKTASAKRINALRQRRGIPVWQRNYYERIIRNDHELNNVWDYMDANPTNWDSDEENR